LELRWAGIVLSMVAIAACFIPDLRAAHVDSDFQALRDE